MLVAKAKRRAREKAWRQANPEKQRRRWRVLLRAAQRRAPARNLAFDAELFNIVLKNIPQNCTCCGIELDYVMKTRSRYNRGPSLDRIDPSQGYTVKNTAFVCGRCNFAKGDATLDELRLLLAYVERETRLRNI